MYDRYQLLSKEVKYLVEFISNWEVFDFDNLQKSLDEMKEIQQNMKNNETNEKTALSEMAISGSNSDENDFSPWSSQEEKDFDLSIMSEYFEEERIEEEKRFKATERIMNALQRIKPCQWFEDLTDYAKESETHNPFRIVKKPKGNYQTESEFESLGGVWVDQHGGYPIEDSFYGTVTVKIDDRRYLEMPYSC